MHNTAISACEKMHYAITYNATINAWEKGGAYELFRSLGSAAVWHAAIAQE